MRVGDGIVDIWSLFQNITTCFATNKIKLKNSWYNSFLWQGSDKNLILSLWHLQLALNSFTKQLSMFFHPFSFKHLSLGLSVVDGVGVCFGGVVGDGGGGSGWVVVCPDGKPLSIIFLYAIIRCVWKSPWLFANSSTYQRQSDKQWFALSRSGQHIQAYNDSFRFRLNKGRFSFQIES